MTETLRQGMRRVAEATTDEEAKSALLMGADTIDILVNHIETLRSHAIEYVWEAQQGDAADPVQLSIKQDRLISLAVVTAFAHDGKLLVCEPDEVREVL